MKIAIVLLGALTLSTALGAAIGTPAGMELISLVQALGPIETATRSIPTPRQCGPVKTKAATRPHPPAM